MVLKCPHCHTTFREKSPLLCHVQNYHKKAIVNPIEKVNENKCGYCKNRYKTQQKLDLHLSEKHPKIQTWKSEKNQEVPLKLQITKTLMWINKYQGNFVLYM